MRCSTTTPSNKKFFFLHSISYIHCNHYSESFYCDLVIISLLCIIKLLFKALITLEVNTPRIFPCQTCLCTAKILKHYFQYFRIKFHKAMVCLSNFQSCHYKSYRAELRCTVQFFRRKIQPLLSSPEWGGVLCLWRVIYRPVLARWTPPLRRVERFVIKNYYGG